MGWHPESGFIERAWDGYNEGKMVYILALAWGRHPAKGGSWSICTAPYERFWRGEGDTRHLSLRLCACINTARCGSIFARFMMLRCGPQASIILRTPAEKPTQIARIALPTRWAGRDTATPSGAS